MKRSEIFCSVYYVKQDNQLVNIYNTVSTAIL